MRVLRRIRLARKQPHLTLLARHRNTLVREAVVIHPGGADFLGAGEHPMTAIARRIEDLGTLVQSLPALMQIAIDGFHAKKIKVDQQVGSNGGQIGWLVHCVVSWAGLSRLVFRSV